MNLTLIALRRLRADAWLAACALAALTIAVALAVAMPVYAEAASLRLLREELERQEARSGRPAFAMLIRYLAASAGALDWEQVAPADKIIAPALDRVGLPVVGYVRHARTGPLALAERGGERPFIDVALGFIGGLDAQMQIVDGAAPRPAASGAPLELLASRSFADRVGLNVGAELTLIGRANGRPVGIPARLAGLWEPINPIDPAWFYPPAAFDEVLLVAESDFNGPLAATLDNEVNQALWFARFDGAGLSAAGVPALAGQVATLRAEVAAALPGARLEQSPAAALESYGGASATLTAQLLVFSAPVIILVIFFVILIGGLMVRRRTPEIALLKTRGVADRQILTLLGIEWIILGAVALAIGAPLGLAFAALMARTSSFLQLDFDLPALALTLTFNHLAFGLAIVALALFAVLLTAARATRQTLVDAQRQAARPERPPFWRRAWLDLLLLPLPVYGIYQLHSQAGILLHVAAGSDLTANPLLILVPALLSLSLSLLALRLLPPFFELAARAATRRPWAAPLLALRVLARRPTGYSGPLLLLMLTLSLAIFSAAAATTLDEALHHGITYQIGATAQLLETGQSTESAGADGRPTRRNIGEEPRFLFVPVGEHLNLPGITAVTRVGRYNAALNLGGDLQLVGIDRLTLPNVLRGFNPAWAGGASLGELMNRLAAQPAGALVSRAILDRGLKIGDRFSIHAEIFGDRRTIELIVVGALDLFPGLYPQDGPFVIADLDQIFDQMGGQYPYDVWIDYAPDADIREIAAGVRQLGIDLVGVLDATSLTRAEQARPQRQGLFGLLSIGFVAAGGLTILGFLVTTAMSARGRTIELGMLRALGLEARDATVVLALEQSVVLVAGLLAGGAIGLLAALLIVPTLQVGVGPHPGTPPIDPRIPWLPMALAATLIVAAVATALAGLATAQRRAHLFTIIKMGDAP